MQPQLSHLHHLDGTSVIDPKQQLVRKWLNPEHLERSAEKCFANLCSLFASIMTGCLSRHK